MLFIYFWFNDNGYFLFRDSSQKLDLGRNFCVVVCFHDGEIRTFVSFALVLHYHLPDLIKQLRPKIIQPISHPYIPVIPHHHIGGIDPLELAFLCLNSLP